MEPEITYRSLEDRAIDELVEGADRLRTIFGVDYDFHDAEVESIHIDRGGKVVVEIWDYEAVSKNEYLITMTLENTHSADLNNFDPGLCYIFEINFTKEKDHGWLEVGIDGVGVIFTCDHVSFAVKQSQTMAK